MKRHDFTSLKEALEFMAAHGKPVEDISEFDLPDFYSTSHGAFGPSSHWVKLEDGSIFGVEAYNHGPLSEVTPDEDMGVNMIGWEA